MSTQQNATVTLSGPPSAAGTYTVTVSGPGTNATLSLRIGGEAGGNSGTASVNIPGAAGNATYTATVTVAGEPLSDDATVQAVRPRTWAAGSAIGTVLDAQGQASGHNGRMTSPQNQAVEAPAPVTPTVVIVRVNDPVTCTVEVATDMDHWTQADNDGNANNDTDYGEDLGDAEDGVTYAWSATGGSFTGSTSGTSASWKASTPGKYTLTCTIDDTPTPVESPDTPNNGREDTAVVRTVEVCVVDPGTVPNGVTNPKFTERPSWPDNPNWGDPDFLYGLELAIDITAYFDFATKKWKCKITKAESKYTTWHRLIPGVDEASEAAATQGNYCRMISDLNRLGAPYSIDPPVGVRWYVEDAVRAHESVHVGEIRTAVWHALDPARATIEALSVDHECGRTAEDAKKLILELSTYTQAVDTAVRRIRAEYRDVDYEEPNRWTRAAEHGIVDPIIERIRARAVREGWAPCN